MTNSSDVLGIITLNRRRTPLHQSLFLTIILITTLFYINTKIGDNNLLVLAQQEDHHQHIQHPQRVEHSRVNTNSNNSLDINISSNTDCINKIDNNNNHQQEFKELDIIMSKEEESSSINNISNDVKDVAGDINKLTMEDDNKPQDVLWTNDISSEMDEYIKLANELTSIQWKDTTIPSKEMYFVNPTKDQFHIMSKQLVSVLVVRLISVVEENNSEIEGQQDDSLLKITSNVLNELKQYVFIILRHYVAVDYHSSEHGLHVTLSANKLLSFILQEDQKSNDSKEEEYHKKISYGIQSSALMHFSFLFSALIHDAEHIGVTNRALMDEEHPLAILYNDQNMLEQQSLTIAFKEFLKTDYDNLRNILFAPDYNMKYNKFRRLVVDLVLCTDIASPERMQLTKSKFREAFGEVIKKRNSLVSGTGRRSSNFSKQSSIDSTVESSQTDDYSSDNEGWLSLGSNSSDEEEKDDSDGDDDDEPQGATPVFSTRRMNLVTDDDIASVSSSSSSSISKEGEGNDQYGLSDSRTGSLPTLPSHISKAKSVGHMEQIRTSKVGSSGGGTSGGVSLTGHVGSRHSSLPTNFFQSRTVRLGIRIALDFTGLTVPRFPDEETKGSGKNKASVSGRTLTANSSINNQKNKNSEVQCKECKVDHEEDLNQEDPLKAQVILELMIRTADVGATMQSFHSFTRWGRRLYFEQKRAFEAGRGVDPDSFWLNGQIAFLDSYAKQLAKSVEDTFVFGGKNNIFVSLIEENKRMWKESGSEIYEQTKNDWKIERSRNN